MTKPQNPLEGAVPPNAGNKAVTEVLANEFTARGVLLTDKEQARVHETYRNNLELLSSEQRRPLNLSPDVREQ